MPDVNANSVSAGACEMRCGLVDLAIWVGQRFDWLSEQLFERQPRFRALLHNPFRVIVSREGVSMASDFDTIRA